MYTVPRGTKDILPDDIRFWHEIESVSRELFSMYNFREIRTPIFEKTELFTKSIGGNTDIVEKEMYTFLDKGNRSLTLRPEGTAPIVRSFVEHMLNRGNQSQKVYYCGPMFRYERPQAGRFRQFHQIGVEHIGAEGPATDAEAICLGVHLFDELGLSDLSVSINSVGCRTCRSVIEERIKQFLGDNLKLLCKDCQRRFNEQPLRILDCKNKTCNTYLSGIPDIRSSHCQECRDHFEAVLEHLDDVGISFQINPRLVRGLAYYTRTTFEVISDKLGAQNAVCGGGRYDNLVKQLGGHDCPAVGFAFGIERTVMILKDMVDYKDKSLTLYIIPIGKPQRNKCFTLQEALRRVGVNCEMAQDDQLKSQLKRANKLGAKYVIIFGEDEYAENQAVLKNMAERTQEVIPFNKIVSTLKELEK